MFMRVFHQTEALPIKLLLEYNWKVIPAFEGNQNRHTGNASGQEELSDFLSAGKA
jgi:hypothetical protein